MMLRGLLVAALIVPITGACKSKKDEKPAEQAKSAQAQLEPANPTEPAKPPELKSNGEEWIPQEHQSGIKKFKTPGIYVDGKLLGILTFGELPLKLPVLWHEEEGAVSFKKGDNGPTTRLIKQRRYSFREYLEAMGVNVKAVKEVHIYGGAKKARATVVRGEMMRKHPKFSFRFGSDVFGKPIPSCPPGVADGKCPDNLHAVTVYVDKKPPTRKHGSFYFGAEKVEGIPYYGEPLRGGIRVYLDGPFVAQIKRGKIEPPPEVTDQAKLKTLGADPGTVEPAAADASKAYRIKLPDGAIRYSFYGFLKAEGVDTSKIVEGWLVHRDRRVKKLTGDELEKLLFATATRGSGQILVGPDRVRTNAIALHTKPVNPKDIPVPEPFEIHDDRTR